jgi:BlaI family penicillinase repressor
VYDYSVIVRPQISEAEASVMEVLWERSPLTASEVCHILRPSTNWAENTVRTLLTRLHKKGAVEAFQNEAGVRVFRPSLEREAFVEAESQSFLKRIFHGAAKPLLAHFATYSDLSREEIEELKSLLERSQTRDRGGA